MNRLLAASAANVAELLEEWEKKTGRGVEPGIVRAIAQDARGFVCAKDAWNVLNRIDKLGSCFGIEAVQGADQVILALYVNVGDCYVPTMLWCGIRHRIYIASVADWLELRERWHGRRFLPADRAA